MEFGLLLVVALFAVWWLIGSHAPGLRELPDVLIEREIEMADGFCETDCIFRDEQRRRADEEA